MNNQKVVSDYRCSPTQHQVTFDQTCLDSYYGGNAEKFFVLNPDVSQFSGTGLDDDTQCKANGVDLRFDLTACNVKGRLSVVLK